VTRFLDKHFAWMTTFLRHKGIKRNSLAETGMRVLRRLEVEHDVFRSEKGKELLLMPILLLRWYFTRSSWESQPRPAREMQRGGNEIHASAYGQTDGDDF
jgi:hypothetical protein